MRKRFVLIMLVMIWAEAGAVAANTAPNQAEFETDEVNIQVDISSSIYTYEVTNLSRSIITSVELKQHAGYNFIIPDGWQRKTGPTVFRAWADDVSTGIQPGETGEFSVRISSTGAVLGRQDVKVEFQSGQTVFVGGVWSPVREPRIHALLVAGVVLGIVLAHSAIVIRKRRATEAGSISDA